MACRPPKAIIAKEMASILIVKLKPTTFIRRVMVILNQTSKDTYDPGSSKGR